MNKFTLILISCFAIGVVGTVTGPANARDFAIHVAGPGYHVDLGRGHHDRGYYSGYRSGYGGGYHRVGRGWYDDDYDYHSDHSWHDTSHYDYHPGYYQQHGNHYHYQPGHYDWHNTGHYDHH